jgi:L-Ala-D/L-Glu epimerase
MARDARTRGLGLMVGNMGGSSLAMAPSFIVGLLCDVIDLDGPLDLTTDRANGLLYRHGTVEPPDVTLWDKPALLIRAFAVGEPISYFAIPESMAGD